MANVSVNLEPHDIQRIVGMLVSGADPFVEPPADKVQSYVTLGDLYLQALVLHVRAPQVVSELAKARHIVKNGVIDDIRD